MLIMHDIIMSYTRTEYRYGLRL